MTDSGRKLSIYEQASAGMSSIVDYYRWERSRCIKMWANDENGAYHLCGLEPDHKGEHVCRHCGKKVEKELSHDEASGRADSEGAGADQGTA